MPKVKLAKDYPHGGKTYPAGAELYVSSSIASKIVGVGYGILVANQEYIGEVVEKSRGIGGGYGILVANQEHIDEVVEKPRGRGRVHSQREAEPADDKDDGVSGGGDNSRPTDG